MMKLVRCFFGLIYGLVVLGCNGSGQLPEPSEASVPFSELDDHPQVIITDTPPIQLPGHGVNVTKAMVSGNLLILTFEYSGGGSTHEYLCYMNSDTFSDSSPERAELYVRDMTSQDVGLMIVSETVAFDLLTVADLYHGRYDFLAPIELNIHYSTTDFSKQLSLIYNPR